MNKIYLLAVSVFALIMISCTDGPCRQLKHPELANQQTTTPTGQAPGVAEPATTPAAQMMGSGLPGATTSGSLAGASMKSGSSTDQKSSSTDAQTVRVYKPDGSLQCGQAKGLSPQEMEKQLRGIKVFSRENRADGMMHIQVCGSPTGMVNVFEIPATSLAEAERQGFKKFEVR